MKGPGELSSYDSPNDPARPLPPDGSKGSVVSTEAPTLERRSFGLGDAMILGGGVFVMLFSFLPFVSYSDSIKGPIQRSGYDTWFNAWEYQTFMAPLTWFAIVAVCGAAGFTIANYFTRRRLTVLSFSGTQLQLGLSGFSFLVVLGYALSSKSLIFGRDYAEYLGDETFAHGVHFSVGGYLMLIFAAVSVVGALLNVYRIGPVLFPRSVKSTVWETKRAESGV